MFFMPPAPPRGSCWKSCSIQRVNINFEDRESRKRAAFFGSFRPPSPADWRNSCQAIDVALNGGRSTYLRRVPVPIPEQAPSPTSAVGLRLNLFSLVCGRQVVCALRRLHENGDVV